MQWQGLQWTDQREYKQVHRQTDREAHNNSVITDRLRHVFTSSSYVFVGLSLKRYGRIFVKFLEAVTLETRNIWLILELIWTEISV